MIFLNRLDINTMQFLLAWSWNRVSNDETKDYLGQWEAKKHFLEEVEFYLSLKGEKRVGSKQWEKHSSQGAQRWHKETPVSWLKWRVYESATEVKMQPRGLKNFSSGESLKILEQINNMMKDPNNIWKNIDVQMGH